MPDIASLVLAVDSTQVKTGTAALDGLTAAGTRAEAATVGLGLGTKGAAAQATAMAAAAQASARATLDQAAGFKVATEAARVNTLAMRETLVVAREIARGNFTRVPGSLSLLAQGIGSQGGFGAYASAIAQQLGLIKQVQNAELAEAAAAAQSAAAGVEAAARRAGANILAADTEVALAEAQLRTAEGATAEAAAQARLAAANEGVAAAAAEAAIAENALAVAQGRAIEASGAAAAASKTILGTTSVVLLALGTIAGAVAIGIHNVKEEFRDDGSLTQFRDNLGLTHAEMLKLSDGVDKVGGKIKELGDVVPTTGDVIKGFFDTLAQSENTSGVWPKFKADAEAAASGAWKAWTVAADGITAAIWYAEDRAIIAWKNFPAAFSDIFVQAVNLAIDALNNLVKHGVSLLNDFIGFADKIPGVHIGEVGTPTIGRLTNANAGAAVRGSAAEAAAPTLAQEYSAAQKADDAFTRNFHNNVALRDIDRLAEEAAALKADRAPKKPKKANDHGLQESLAKLNADIKGQYALAEAYLVSDAAAQRAAALQKAEEDAISHKSKAGVFYELELQKAVASDIAQSAKQVASLRDETAARQRVNAMVAAGIVPAALANQQYQIELTLIKARADYENADTAHKAEALKVLNALTDAQKANNDAVAKGKALAEIASNDNEIEKMRLETSLLGASNRERAVALAQLEAIQKLNDLGVNDPVTRANYVNSEVNKALAGVQSPFQQWAKDIPQTADAINEALQKIEVNGFDNLASSITDVITGTKNLGQAFGDISRQIVSDILQMIIKMLIFRAISSIFGGGNFGQPAGWGNAPYGLAAGGVLSRGNIIPFATGGIFNSPTMFPMSGGRTGLMGEAGPEAVMPLARDNQGRLGVRAANSNGPQVVEIRLVTEPSDNAWAKVSDISVQTVKGAAPLIVKAAVNGATRTFTRQRIPGSRV